MRNWLWDQLAPKAQLISKSLLYGPAEFIELKIQLDELL